ncbi:hypothetical protein [Pseudoalteromonas sp.]|uniref:hypothetical protein n=1 Tax=Pseudoalteromonas sp. TaxID=53249 RepID=UPI002729CB0E|nr:hypothetical protein [Pseudoalteromonas sp.]
MDDLIVHCQVSLLRLVTELAEDLSTKYNTVFEGINMDAALTESELPDSHIIGLEDFSFQERDDPVAVVSGQITVGSKASDQNMLLLRALSLVLKKTKATKAIVLQNTDTAEVIGQIVFDGYRQVPPKFTGETKVYQSVIFTAGILLDV